MRVLTRPRTVYVTGFRPDLLAGSCATLRVHVSGFKPRIATPDLAPTSVRSQPKLGVRTPGVGARSLGLQIRDIRFEGPGFVSVVGRQPILEATDEVGASSLPDKWKAY